MAWSTAKSKTSSSVPEMHWSDLMLREVWRRVNGGYFSTSSHFIPFLSVALATVACAALPPTGIMA